MTKDIQFYNELKLLLRKYDAEISMETFGSKYTSGSGWSKDNKIVVDFGWNPKTDDEIPQLVLGTWEDGN